MKRGRLGTVIFIAIIFFLLSLSLASASWFSDFLDRVTGQIAEHSYRACRDSDGGLNLYVRGDVLYKVWNLWKEHNDGCYDKNTIIEYYCDYENKPKKVMYLCEEGCEDGACIGGGVNGKYGVELTTAIDTSVTVKAAGANEPTAESNVSV
ncbi:MAG: hypothetical protein AABX71_03580 [Nanoarchaeota archaeon]